MSVTSDFIKDYERRLNALNGERLASVQYTEIAYETGKPCWRSTDFDTVDYGAQLNTESGKSFSVIWHSTFDFGLMFYEGDLGFEAVSTAATWDVTRNSRWSRLIGKPIEEAKAFWTPTDPFETEGVEAAPWAIGFTFEKAETVYLVYGEFHENDPTSRGLDNVTIFFGDETARAYRVGPFGADEFRYTGESGHVVEAQDQDMGPSHFEVVKENGRVIIRPKEESD